MPSGHNSIDQQSKNKLDEFVGFESYQWQKKG